eukprot:5651614-Karenia_brevis.AAC.1
MSDDANDDDDDDDDDEDDDDDDDDDGGDGGDDDDGDNDDMMADQIVDMDSNSGSTQCRPSSQEVGRGAQYFHRKDPAGR